MKNQTFDHTNFDHVIAKNCGVYFVSDLQQVVTQQVSPIIMINHAFIAHFHVTAEIIISF